MKKLLSFFILLGMISMVSCSNVTEVESSPDESVSSNSEVQSYDESSENTVLSNNDNPTQKNPEANSESSSKTSNEERSKKNMGQQPDVAPPYDWIDPNTQVPEGVQYKLYDTTARGVNTQGSYLIYLPESYQKDETRDYPVIYFLHGGFGYSTDQECTLAIEGYVESMKKTQMPESIIVVPQALPSGWYCNSKDGQRPVEDVIIKDLIPHIDDTYRTINTPQARGIEGMSMGGYGALHLGLKYPEIFGVVSSVAPAIRKSILDEPEIRTADTFFGDEDYFYECSPWGLIKSNTEDILKNSPKIRILGGEKDDLSSVLEEYDLLMTDLGVEHVYEETSGAGHEYSAIIAGNSDAYSFWNEAFYNL